MTSSTIVAGLDLGGRELRVRVPGENPTIAWPKVAMPSLWLPRGLGGGGGDEGGRVASVKRVLDFDQNLAIPPEGLSPIEYVRARVGEVHARLLEHAPGKRIRWIVAVPPCASQRQRAALQSVFTSKTAYGVRLVDDTVCALFAGPASIASARRVMVYSWGASTFSSAVYQREEGRVNSVAQAGHWDLGGDNLDEVLLGDVVQWIGTSPERWSSDLLQEVLTKIRSVKAQLLMGESVRLDLASSAGGARRTERGPNLSPDACLSRMRAMLDATIKLARGAWDEASVRGRPECILLTGGMTRIPAVAHAVKSAFGVDVVEAGIDAVVEGAALIGTKLPDEAWEVWSEPVAEPTIERTAHSLSWCERFRPYIDEAQQRADSGQNARVVEAVDDLFRELALFTAEFYRRQAAELDARGQLETAAHLLDRAHRRDPTNRLVAKDLSELRYRQCQAAHRRREYRISLRLADEGLRALEALSAAPDEYAEVVAKLSYLKAVALWNLEQWTQGLEAAEISVRLAPRASAFRDARDKMKKQLAEMRQTGVASSRTVKGSDRNKMCWCGSGKKVKHCHGA